MHPSEAQWEQLALDHLAEPLGWAPLAGKQIAPGATSDVGHPGYAALGEQPQRESWSELAIPSRLRSALRRLNPDVPREYLDQALTEILTPSSQDAITENKRIHDFLARGYRITFTEDGREQTPTVRLVSSLEHENEWLVANQVTVVDGDVERRFDLVLYLNGMPVAIVELKNAGSAHADVAAAHAQLTTYVRELPMAFRFCVLTVISDGVIAKYGTPFTPLNHYAPWNVDDEGRVVGPDGRPEGERHLHLVDEDGLAGEVEPLTPLEVTLNGLFNPERFGQLLRGFVAFDADEDGLHKRIAKPHQYFAVTKAVGATVNAVEGDGRAGVVWHTQGSGKSMEMELYAAAIARHPKLLNPTIVVITDRTDLDDQLYETFRRSQLLTEEPKQVMRRAELRDELANRTTGGIYFTTLQKFGLTAEEKRAGRKHPVLSERRNVVLIVDEAHRSHYDNLDGYAWHLKNALPNATLIAFTGTPVKGERDTEAVFGDVIDVYDLTRAVADGATVPVYFESRLVKVGFPDDVDPETIDAAADEATVGLDDAERARIEKSVTVVNAVYGAPARLKTLAADLVQHWEDRRDAVVEMVRPTHSEGAVGGAPGKALVVCATREICARLYEQIVELRPDWHSADITAGKVKVVYSGDATDQPPVADHVRRDGENAMVKNRLKDPDDELEIVIVKDMLLTGFDAPPLHTLYLDRPLRGALLMQTLARVNRTFRGKDAGLLVAYAPIAENLTAALAEYTVRDQAEQPIGKNLDELAETTRALVEALRELVAPTRWRDRLEKARNAKRGYIDAVLHVVNWLRDPQNPGNQVPDDSDEEKLADAFRRRAQALVRAWAAAGRHEALADLHDEARFYEEVRVWMGKLDAEDRQARGEPIPEDVQRLLNQLTATAVDARDVVDVYEAAGLEHPRLDQIDGDFLAKAQASPNPQITIEALRALITSEARALTRGNIVRRQMFSERLAELMLRYTNSNLTSAEVIQALVEMAKDLAAEATRGQRFEPPLDHDELAFFDAVAQNESAVLLQGDDKLAEIARELVGIMRRDVKTDWTVRDDVRAKMRSSIKRLLIKHKYPPDRQPEAIRLVMEQMEALAPRYAA
ncbi:type I restriction endonuclease subunit R [Isoptericola variabilis]|uniref:Type I restriction enzyme endonuclease subunit n=1 Tax=Isoptericola variabilis (strain 225) TaxID=743718 RepID=F6FPF2_ISOV2|nr:type I restriction endonuclease subunit R [Isoptericola variabilis]AEG43665.1 type I site-specific deoxyribonuclease, HsdR family [Isoptericola variabilis 225]